MLTHIVWWTFKPEADGKSAAQNATLIRDRLRALEGVIPELLGISVSDSVLPASTEKPSLVLVTRHKDETALAAYAAHPRHQEVLAMLGSAAAERRAIDFFD